MAEIPDERTFEDIDLPVEVEGFTQRRVELVQKAVKDWTHQLVDLGGRNNLLRYRDLKAGTLELTGGCLSSRMRRSAVEFSEQPPLSWAC